MKATTLDDAGRVRAALAAADDPEVLLTKIFSELKRGSPDVVRQFGGMYVTGGRPVYPMPSAQPDNVVFARLLERHPALVADALRRVEGSRTS